MRRILSALFGILIIAWVTPALAQDSAGEKLQRWEGALTKIEQQLVANPELPADRYREILQTVQALVAEANGLRTAEQQAAREGNQSRSENDGRREAGAR